MTGSSPWEALRRTLGLPEGLPVALLEQAFRHSSYVRERRLPPVESNQRLEFLGDAVLDLIVAEALYWAYPGMPEGMLTRAKAAIVRADALAEIAQRLELGRYLLLGRGEEETGGREKPSLLAAAFEALLGAIYLGAGLDAAQAFVLRHVDLASAVGALAEQRFDHKTALQELVQRHVRTLPEYRILHVEGPAHRLHFCVEVSVGGLPLARGEGRSKRRAEQEAAREALLGQAEWLPRLLGAGSHPQKDEPSGKTAAPPYSNG